MSETGDMYEEEIPHSDYYKDVSYIITRDGVPMITEPDWFSAVDVAQQWARDLATSRQLLYPLDSFMVSCEERINNSAEQLVKIVLRRRSTSMFPFFRYDAIDAVFGVHPVYSKLGG